MRLTAGVMLLLAGFTAPANAQQPLRPGACAAAGPAAEGWVDFSHPALQLALRLPAELHPVGYNALQKVSNRARRKEIPGADSAGVELVLAWELPGKSAGPLRQVLIYRARGSAAPEGRPCALTIAGSPGLVFRSALTSANHASDEYWIEAYWPGWVFAASGATAGVYEAALAVLRSVVAAP